MATAYEIIHKTTFGNMKVHVISCLVDAASANIDTGLSKIYTHQLGVVSMSTAGVTMKKNIGSGATALLGIMNVNSAVSGDVFHLTVYGV